MGLSLFYNLHVYSEKTVKNFQININANAIKICIFYDSILMLNIIKKEMNKASKRKIIRYFRRQNRIKKL